MTLSAKKLVDCYRELSGYDRRTGGKCKNPAVLRLRRQRLELVETDGEFDLHPRIDGRSKVSILARGNAKVPGENLSPLWRYLLKHVGQPWDSTFSKLCSIMDRRGAVSGHLFDHLFDYVTQEHLVVMIDGKPHRRTAYGGRVLPIQFTGKIGFSSGFWVDPRDGLLKRGIPHKRPNRAKLANEQQAIKASRLRKMNEYLYYSLDVGTGTWYRLEYRNQEYRTFVKLALVFVDGTRTYVNRQVREARYRNCCYVDNCDVPKADESKYLYKLGVANKRELAMLRQLALQEPFTRGT